MPHCILCRVLIDLGLTSEVYSPAFVNNFRQRVEAIGTNVIVQHTCVPPFPQLSLHSRSCPLRKLLRNIHKNSGYGTLSSVSCVCFGCRCMLPSVQRGAEMLPSESPWKELLPLSDLSSSWGIERVERLYEFWA